MPRAFSRSGASRWPADQISAEQAAARGPSLTQTIFPFCPAATAFARDATTLFHGQAWPIQETTMTTKTKAIRALNDELRQNFTTGTAVMTLALPPWAPKQSPAS